MNSTDKVKQLSDIVQKEIIPLIDNDYVLYGLPYYSNIGDTLIWEGELELLKNVPHRCVGTCGWDRYPLKPVKKDVIVLITGGGYFGDTWRQGWKFVLDGIKGLEENRIIILPNSIHYSDVSIRDEDSEYLSRFPKLIICARDQFSYDYAKKYFRNKVILVPDMAFCISVDRFRKQKLDSEKILYLKRTDKELSTQLPDEELAGNIETSDWPTMDKPKFSQKLFYKSIRALKGLYNHGLIYGKSLRLLENTLYYLIHRPMMISEGVSFITNYKKIYTTRLHAMILGILLNKEVVFLDNSYGKLRNYYNTWLKDCDNVIEL